MSQVLRWSALGLGVAYGFYHQTTITAADKLRENQKVYEHKQALINQARQEYQKKTAPKSKSGGMSPHILHQSLSANSHTLPQPSPIPATPSSTSKLGSSRSNRQFTLHILPHRPSQFSHPRSHEEDACFLIPTTKMRSYLCPPSST